MSGVHSLLGRKSTVIWEYFRRSSDGFVLRLQPDQRTQKRVPQIESSLGRLLNVIARFLALLPGSGGERHEDVVEGLIHDPSQPLHGSHMHFLGSRRLVRVIERLSGDGLESPDVVSLFSKSV